MLDLACVLVSTLLASLHLRLSRIIVLLVVFPWWSNSEMQIRFQLHCQIDYSVLVVKTFNLNVLLSAFNNFDSSPHSIYPLEHAVLNDSYAMQRGCREIDGLANDLPAIRSEILSVKKMDPDYAKHVYCVKVQGRAWRRVSGLSKTANYSLSRTSSMRIKCVVYVLVSSTKTVFLILFETLASHA